mgnify:CR=1 FL=1
MSEQMTRRYVLHGHTIEQRWYEFPHLCPGFGCAIAMYLFQRDLRATYESLEPAPLPHRPHRAPASGAPASAPRGSAFVKTVADAE